MAHLNAKYYFLSLQDKKGVETFPFNLIERSNGNCVVFG